MDIRLAVAQRPTTARALLHRLLGPSGGRVAKRRSGQPYLPDHPDVTVSMSHDGDWVAAAVGIGVAVGVDVQVPLPVSPRLLRRCCTPEAQATLAAMPDAARDLEFAWIWTVQEACVKAEGTGFAGGPWRIPVGVGRRTGSWGDYRWHSLRDRSVPVSYAYRAVPA